MRILGSYVWVMVLGGNAYWMDSKHTQQSFHRGDCVLFGPEQSHAYGSADGKVWDQLYVVFNGPLFDQLMAERTFREDLPNWHLEPVELWQRRLEEVLTAGPIDSAAENLRTVSRFANLLVEMACHQASSQGDQETAWLERSKQLLGEPQSGHWLDAHAVAKINGRSYESFRKQFREAVGQSPHRFQQQRRIDLACAAIYRGTESFQSIAEALGFCDIYHFSRTFRRIKGIPPSTYRQQVRGT